MFRSLRPAIVSLFAFTLLTGLAYPLVITGLARVLFPDRASGSLLVEAGRVRGSTLIGQPFRDPRYFWGRPSATAPAYNAADSSGSNLGPLNPSLLDAVKARIAALREADPTNTAQIPVDLVTASGSGLDPHISVAAARYQSSRVARARGLSLEVVESLVARHTAPRQLGCLGEPCVNVLRLNLALEAERAR